MHEWQFAAPVGGVQSAHLEIRGGALRLNLVSGAGMPDLCRARFAGLEPDIDVHHGQVTVEYGHFGLFDWIEDVLLDRGRAAQIVLTSQVPWTVQLRGGVSKVDADLSAVRLSSMEIRGGASQVTLTLPRPVGVVPVHIRGGASKLTICRPDGAATCVRIQGGASALVLDGERVGAMGGRQELTTPGFDAAPDRYEIEIHGGASKLSVMSYPLEQFALSA